MDCLDAKKFIQTYLDGELVEDERVEVATHLASCGSCQAVARLEQGFKARIAACNADIAAPQRLRARLGASLDGVDRELEQQHLVAQRRRRWAWRLAPIAAVAGFTAVAVGVQPRGEERDAVAEQTVSWHRARLPLDVKGSETEAIRTFFRDKVPFAVRLPRFAHAKHAQLVGARLTNLAGQRAVALTYHVDGERVSVFVVDPRAIGARQVSEPKGRDIRWRGVRGYTVGTFVSGGTGYAITSEMDRQNLVRLVSYR